jgi:hypothetical protein
MKFFFPNPGIARRIPTQSAPNRILQYIFDLGIKILGRPQDMVKRFRLPNLTSPSKSFVDHVRRGPFDRVHDLCEGTDFHRLIAGQRREDEMNVIRHNHSSFEVKFRSVVVKATIQDNTPNALRKNPSIMSAESDKVRFIVNLKMRKPPPIKSLRHLRTM